MLYNKLQCHRSIGAVEEDLVNVFTICGHGGHLGHVTQLICINLHSHSSKIFV